MKNTLILFTLLLAILYSLNALFFKEEKLVENDVASAILANSSSKLTPIVQPDKVQTIKAEVPNELKVSINAALEDEQFIPEEETYTDNLDDSNSIEAKKHLPFKDQVVDHDWAIDITYKMYDLFASHEELTEHNIKDIECRATLCHLQFYIVDEDDAISQAQVAGKILTTGNWQGHSVYLLMSPDPQVLMIELGRFKEN